MLNFSDLLGVCDNCKALYESNDKNILKISESETLCAICADEYIEETTEYFETQTAMEESSQYDYE